MGSKWNQQGLRAATSISAAVLCVLAGCGGSDGGSAAASAEAAAAASLASASTLTVAQYQAQRSAAAGTNTGTGTGTATPADAAQQASLRSADQALAVGQWQTDFAGSNPVVLPPLAYASARALATAAQGDTLAQLNTLLAGRITLAPDAAAAAWQTGQVASAGWAAQGFKLARGFLGTIDSSDGRLAAWSLADAAFADGSAFNDATLTQALAAQGLALTDFAAATNLRLLLTHTLKLAGGWPAGDTFDGLFEVGPQDLLSLPLLRLRTAVKRLAGSDYTADLLAAGPLRVLSLRPAAGELAAFATTRLAPALAAAVQTLLVDGGGTAGELLLPLGTLALDAAVDAPIQRAGASLVFDEVNANLRGLDEVGGTYAQVKSAPASLVVSADGLALSAAHGLGLTYSVRNVYGDGFGVGVTVFDGRYPVIHVNGPCTPVWPSADLRSFFLAVLDSRGALLALMAVQHPSGTAYVPSCGG